MRARDSHWPGCYSFLVALLTLGGCTTADKAALKEYAPKSADADIEAVSLSASSNDTFEPTRVGTEFPDPTQQVAVWYRWAKADSGKKVGIRWSKDGEVVLEQADTLAEVSGTSAYILKMAAGSKLPIGSYQVELLENDVAVTKIPFKVGSGGTETGGPVATESAQNSGPAPGAEGGSADSAAATPASAAATDTASALKAGEPAAAEPAEAATAEAPTAEAQPASAAAGTAVGGGPAQETKWPGITAQITELARKGKILSAKVRFTNNGTKRIRPEFYYTDTYLLDANNKKYEVLKDEKGTYLGSLTTGYPNWWGEYLDPGASQTVWMRFPPPPAGVTVLTLQVAGMDPFEDVPVQN